MPGGDVALDRAGGRVGAAEGDICLEDLTTRAGAQIEGQTSPHCPDALVIAVTVTVGVRVHAHSLARAGGWLTDGAIGPTASAGGGGIGEGFNCGSGRISGWGDGGDCGWMVSCSVKINYSGRRVGGGGGWRVSGNSWSAGCGNRIGSDDGRRSASGGFSGHLIDGVKIPVDPEAAWSGPASLAEHQLPTAQWKQTEPSTREFVGTVSSTVIWKKQKCNILSRF